MEHNIILHVPVLVEDVLTYLQLKKDMVIIDCTIGVGGHAVEILKKIGNQGLLIGIDRDREALEEARKRLNKISHRFKLFYSNYKDVDSILKEAKIRRIDGALFDLGASSFQMDRRERGFSLRLDGPLDMRMDRGDKIKASDIVNSCTKQELASLFRRYGEEGFASRIADRIVKERKKQRIENTKRLADIVRDTLPYHYRFKKIHPATKVFMALRIAVNKEIENLEIGLTKIVPFLREGSRICVISFHSIEDRVVKHKFRELAKSHKLRIVTKKPIRPEKEEIKENPRSRSAKLRVAERVREI